LFDKKISPAEIMKEIKKHKAKTKSIILETLNDLPDADLKPPENVLFVCKLNSVTTERDLETIFSVYGAIKKCDVIRDWRTGQSLQYAFIEFETKAACEEAYFKMDNTLIDDRRIHVDFSQSVSKLWNKFKNKRDDHPGQGDNVLKKQYTKQDAKLILDDEYSKKPQRSDPRPQQFKKPRDREQEEDKSKKRKRSVSKHRSTSSSSLGSSDSSSRKQNRRSSKRSRSRDKIKRA
jgi:peptidyl-prolyl cis-trans isomerase-like 4